MGDQQTDTTKNVETYDLIKLKLTRYVRKIIQRVNKAKSNPWINED
ncbi:hypothetical protein SynA1825c_01627 [Synechococcus sp. A18-25c]|nr:hypothetical protein SynA1560_01642 [Synechococcus sp. A15-60]QNJ19931.1 hypothetical protein SynA1825c_01627 [Synechococcus sp. A18-25c]